MKVIPTFPVRATTKRVFEARSRMTAGDMAAALSSIPADARITEIERQEALVWGGSDEFTITAELTVEEGIE